METALRSALVGWLRADPILAGMVNAIEEEGPIAASPPHIAIAASASTDWSTKTGLGREIRLVWQPAGNPHRANRHNAMADRASAAARAWSTST